MILAKAHNGARHRRSAFTKRRLQLVLAALWGLDGLLQLQPAMFTPRFANQVLLPVTGGQPAWVARPVTTVVHLVLHQPAAFNSAFAAIQLALAAGLAYRRTARPALVASVVWALGVWCAGEGLGELFSGQPTLFTGAPGAALLYAVLALAAWPPAHPRPGEPPGSPFHEPPAAWLKWVWAALWVGGALLLFMPWNISNDVLWQRLMDNSMAAPGWIATLNQHAANLLPAGSVALVFDLAVLQLLVGLGVLVPRRRLVQAAVAVGITLQVVYWLLGQTLGMLWSGLATDPGTAPLIILLGLAVMARSRQLASLRRRRGHNRAAASSSR